jgi:hypothetical protein
LICSQDLSSFLIRIKPVFQRGGIWTLQLDVDIDLKGGKYDGYLKYRQVEMKNDVKIDEIIEKVMDKDRLFLKLKDIAHFLGVDVATIYIYDEFRKELILWCSSG